MKIVVMIGYFSITVLLILHGNVAEEKVVPSCPIRPANDIRGPPGIQGKPGSKGNYALRYSIPQQ